MAHVLERMVTILMGEGRTEMKLAFAAYGFQNGPVYRSATGYRLFEYLTDLLRQRNPG